MTSATTEPYADLLVRLQVARQEAAGRRRANVLIETKDLGTLLDRCIALEGALEAVKERCFAADGDRNWDNDILSIVVPLLDTLRRSAPSLGRRLLATEERIALIEAAILDDLQRVAPLSGSEIDIDYETGCVGFNGTFRPVEIARAIAALTRTTLTGEAR